MAVASYLLQNATAYQSKMIENTNFGENICKLPGTGPLMFRYIDEAKEEEVIKAPHLRVNLVDMDHLVKANDLKPVTNPITFQRNNIPTPDGLLSNEIFGITMYDRMNTCAYIDLHEWFLHPLVYKVWSKLDKNIIACINETKYFSISDKGTLVEDDENGKTGVKFLRDNFTKLKFHRTASTKRDMNVDFIEACQKDPTGVWVRKWMIIPAALRDVDTSKGGRISIGEINEIYRNLILACRALSEVANYGLDMAGATRGRVQNTLIQIYDYFGTGTTINGTTTGSNIPGKVGVMRRSVMSKTTDYASRLVISAPELKVDSLDQMAADLDYASVPLASLISNFTPFMIFACKRYFENAFSGNKAIPIIDEKTGQERYVYPKNYQMQFSEDVIKKQMTRFCHGSSNRLIPITVETTDDEVVTLRFKGFNTTLEDYKKGVGLQKITDRRFTWCDLFFICANEVVQDKHVLVCRYPFDSIYNQFPIKVHVASTNETEPMVVDDVFYLRYPKIEDKDIGKNTSNMFVDSLNLCNLYLEGMKGDYDGDTTTVKPVYSVEANLELENAMNQPYNYINMGGKPIRVPGNEAIQSLFSLTRRLPDCPPTQVPTFTGK